jgi:hypothetical protein
MVCTSPEHGQYIKCLNEDCERVLARAAPSKDGELPSLKFEHLFDDDAFFAQTGLPADSRPNHRKRWSSFCDWCSEDVGVPLPASQDTLMDFIAFLASRHAAEKIAQYLETIRIAHRAHPDPTSTPLIQALLEYVRRVEKSSSRAKTAADLRFVVDRPEHLTAGISNKSPLAECWLLASDYKIGQTCLFATEPRAERAHLASEFRAAAARLTGFPELVQSLLATLQRIEDCL